MTKVEEMRENLATLREETQALLDAGEISEAKEKLAKANELKDAIAVQEALDREAEKQMQDKAKKQPPEKKDAVAMFAAAVRSRFKDETTMTEGTDGDGGYTVPNDIQTMILERREAKASLLNYVDVESVTTNKGRRTFKKRAQQKGFSEVSEAGKIGQTETPQFEVLDYTIKKYAGWLPVTNELLADSDANITAIVTGWLGDESRVTANKNIITAIKTNEETELKGLDDIKKALNVTLGAAFKSTSAIVTNDDGLQYLDTLKDANGRDMLQPDPTSAATLRLRAGATTVPIVVIPNADLPTETQKVPMIIGDLKEGIKFFDRNQTSIKISDIAVAGELNAFENDLTLFRGIVREDVQVKDKEAFVNGYISVGE